MCFKGHHQEHENTIHRRIFLPTVYIRDSDPKHIKNSYKSTIKRQLIDEVAKNMKKTVQRGQVQMANETMKS